MENKPSLTPSRPKVAIVVLVFKDDKVLLGRRISSGPDHGMFGTPGGHLEYLESFGECVEREVAEEVGITVENIQPIAVSNVRELAPLHYIVIGLRADWKRGEVQLREPDRCEAWEWFDVNTLPSPLTPATRDVILAFQSGEIFFEPRISSSEMGG